MNEINKLSRNFEHIIMSNRPFSRSVISKYIIKTIINLPISRYYQVYLNVYEIKNPWRKYLGTEIVRYLFLYLCSIKCDKCFLDYFQDIVENLGETNEINTSYCVICGNQQEATLVPEFAVEDLPSGRTAALVHEFAVKDLPLGRKLWWRWWCS